MLLGLFSEFATLSHGDYRYPVPVPGGTGTETLAPRALLDVRDRGGRKRVRRLRLVCCRTVPGTLYLGTPYLVLGTVPVLVVADEARWIG